MSCAAVALLTLVVGAPDITAAFGEGRTISIYNIHTKETLTVLYKKDGEYIPSAMEKVNWIMRDWRRDKAREMKPELVDIMWEMHTELGSKEPIHLISGYRSLKTNNMLRKTRGGQAKRSRHIYGMAADIHFPDVPVKRMRYSAMVRERGGVGYYPTSAIPFVHVDTGRVRHWPRMPRGELALLFPDGTTKHRPRGGGAVSSRDRKRAQSRNPGLARQVAEFRELHARPLRPVLVADAGSNGKIIKKDALGSDNKKKGLDIPRPVLASLGSPSGTLRAVADKLVAKEDPKTAADKSRGVKVASISPEAVMGSGADSSAETAGGPESSQRAAPVDTELFKAQRTAQKAFSDMTGWATAPRFDLEHPSELNYRRFPVAPLLTADANINTPALIELIHPDLAAARDLIGRADEDLPLGFEPGLQTAEMMWADLFTGGGVNNVLAEAPVLTAGGARRLRTANRN